VCASKCLKDPDILTLSGSGPRLQASRLAFETNRSPNRNFPRDVTYAHLYLTSYIAPKFSPLLYTSDPACDSSPLLYSPFDSTMASSSSTTAHQNAESVPYPCLTYEEFYETTLPSNPKPYITVRLDYVHSSCKQSHTWNSVAPLESETFVEPLQGDVGSALRSFLRRHTSKWDKVCAQRRARRCKSTNRVELILSADSLVAQLSILPLSGGAGQMYPVSLCFHYTQRAN
jgi:hypothetical protein